MYAKMLLKNKKPSSHHTLTNKAGFPIAAREGSTATMVLYARFGLEKGGKKNTDISITIFFDSLFNLHSMGVKRSLLLVSDRGIFAIFSANLFSI